MRTYGRRSYGRRRRYGYSRRRRGGRTRIGIRL